MHRRFFKEGLLMAVWGSLVFFIMQFNHNLHKRCFINLKSIDKHANLSFFEKSKFCFDSRTSMSSV